MKIGNLFNLLHDCQDLLANCDNVANPPQMTSCLERLKRGQMVLDFNDTIEALRLSLSQVFDDQLEMGGALTDDNEDTLADELLHEVPFDESLGSNETTSQDETNPSSPPNEKTTT